MQALSTDLILEILTWCSVMDWVRFRGTSRSSVVLVEQLRLSVATRIRLETDDPFELFFLTLPVHRYTTEWICQLETVKWLEMLLIPNRITHVYMHPRSFRIKAATLDYVEPLSYLIDEHAESLQECTMTCQNLETYVRNTHDTKQPQLTHVHIVCCGDDEDENDHDTLAASYIELLSRSSLASIQLDTACLRKIQPPHLIWPYVVISPALESLTLADESGIDASQLSDLYNSFQHCRLQKLNLHIRQLTETTLIILHDFIDRHRHTLTDLTLRLVCLPFGTIATLLIQNGTTTFQLGALPRLRHLHLSQSGAAIQLRVQWTHAPVLTCLILDDILYEFIRYHDPFPLLQEAHVWTRQWRNVDAAAVRFPQLQKLVIWESKDSYASRPRHCFKQWLARASIHSPNLQTLIIGHKDYDGQRWSLFTDTPDFCFTRPSHVAMERFIVRQMDLYGLTDSERKSFQLCESSPVMNLTVLDSTLLKSEQIRTWQERKQKKKIWRQRMCKYAVFIICLVIAIRIYDSLYHSYPDQTWFYTVQFVIMCVLLMLRYICQVVH